MIYRMPTYYKDFKCIADKCPDTCCEGWAIMIDEKAMERYKKLSENNRSYVLANIDQKEQCFRQKGDRCSFLNENNLCDLIIRTGEQNLCRTCRIYPRHFEEYGNLIEGCLSISCPVVAEMVLFREEKDRTAIRNTSEQSPHASEVDEALLESLLMARKKLFGIVTNRALSVAERMEQMLLFSEKIQRHIYAYEKIGFRQKLSMNKRRLTERIKQDIQAFSEETGNGRKLKQCKNRTMEPYMKVLFGLEQLNGKWCKLVEKLAETLYEEMTVEEYQEKRSEYLAVTKEFEVAYEHLLFYFLYTYYLGGVYDYNVHAMVKLAIYSVLCINELGFFVYLQNGNTFSKQDMIRCSYLFSRELEHSDENLSAMEGMLNAHPLFADSGTDNMYQFIRLCFEKLA